MADELQKHFSVKADLIASKGGVFEVTKDNILIFSKKKENRFPENDEIINIINEMN